MNKLRVALALWALLIGFALVPTAALAVGHGAAMLPSSGRQASATPKAAVHALDTAGQMLFATGLPEDIGTEFYVIQPYSTNPAAIDLGTFPDFIGQIAFNPADGRLYAVNLTGAIIQFAPDLSTWTYIAQAASGASFSFKFDIDGTAYAVGLGDNDSNLYRLDPTTGNLTLIGDTGFLFAGGDLAFDTDGSIYASTGDNGQLLHIDKHTGAAVLVGDLGIAGAYGLDIDVDGTIYGGVGSLVNGAAELFTANRAGGAAHTIGIIAGADGIFGLSSMTFSKRISSSTPPGGGGGPLALEFPLKGTTPGADQQLDPYTAPILAVFDHQLSDATQRSRPFVPYRCDRAVVAYTGERGDRTPNAATCADHPGYTQRRGTFHVNGHYVGTTGGANFLNSDGSPAFDYAAATGTQVYAAVSGTVHYPTAHIGLADPYNRFHVLEIIPDGAPGFRVYYLHLSTHPSASGTQGTFSDPSPASGCPASMTLPLAEGAHVDAGCLVALSGDAGTADRTGHTHPQLHFEVHRVVSVASGKLPVSSPQRCVDEAAINDGGHACVPVDPYGWLPTAKDPYVALTGVSNTNLWAVAPH